MRHICAWQHANATAAAAETGRDDRERASVPLCPALVFCCSSASTRTRGKGPPAVTLRVLFLPAATLMTNRDCYFVTSLALMSRASRRSVLERCRWRVFFKRLARATRRTEGELQPHCGASRPLVIRQRRSVNHADICADVTLMRHHKPSSLTKCSKTIMLPCFLDIL